MIIAALTLLGLAFGSFITAFTWRLHEKKNFVSGRSQCEHCGHTLGALDLVPVLSWLWLRGRCRYCAKPIGWHNPLLELIVAGLFVGSYIWWPVALSTWPAIASFILWLVFLVLLVALVVYDIRWMLLPDAIVYPLIALALIDAGLRQLAQPYGTVVGFAEHVLFGAAALGGFYWLLHTVSKGRWVGYGDVKLGLFMGIVLGGPGALLTLFLANLLAFVVVVPGLLTGKLTRKSRVPFGPFMIAGFIISVLFGQVIINWYLTLLLVH